VGDKDLAFFKYHAVQGGPCEGASPWQLMMTKDMPGFVRYQSWRRSLPDGKTEYKSVTISPNATAREFADMYLDDDFRRNWVRGPRRRVARLARAARRRHPCASPQPRTRMPGGRGLLTPRCAPAPAPAPPARTHPTRTAWFTTTRCWSTATSASGSRWCAGSGASPLPF
jgi:hypothetical protein